jgi:hypothetical protein
VARPPPPEARQRPPGTAQAFSAPRIEAAEQEGYAEGEHRQAAPRVLDLLLQVSPQHALERIEALVHDLQVGVGRHGWSLDPLPKMARLARRRAGAHGRRPLGRVLEPLVEERPAGAEVLVDRVVGAEDVGGDAGASERSR